MKGQIIKIIAGFYDIFANDKIYRVRGSGKLRLQDQKPLVGDFVEFIPKKHITKIYDRKNQLLRPKVANVDQIAIVTSIVEPKYNSFLLNKFLAVIEFNNIKPLLIFTKKDLSNQDPSQEYVKMGYQVFAISNKTNENLLQLNNLFMNKITVFAGQTGAGKSSTISSVTGIKLATQEISRALGRGKHTTRVVEVIDWHKGWLIDTPGFSTFETNLTKEQLALSYYIFRKFSAKCKFKNCMHIQEVNCGVKDAVAKKEISEQRYKDYLRLHKEILNG